MLALTIREKNGEERQLIFEKEEVTIGRATGSDIVLPRNNISKRHARLVDKHDKVVIVDLRSTNGTYVNGRRITAPELLTYDDKVYIGDFVIRLSRPAEQHPSQRMTAPYSASPTPAEPRVSRAPTAAAEPVSPGEVPDFGAFDEPLAAEDIQQTMALGDAPPPFEEEAAAFEEDPAAFAEEAAPFEDEEPVYEAAPEEEHEYEPEPVAPAPPPPMELGDDESTRAITAFADEEEPVRPAPRPAQVSPLAPTQPPMPAPKPTAEAIPMPRPRVPAPQPVAPVPQPVPLPQPTARAPRPEAVAPAPRAPVAPEPTPAPRMPEPAPRAPQAARAPEPVRAAPAPVVREVEPAESADPWVAWNALIEAVMARVPDLGLAPGEADAVVADAIALAIDEGAVPAETDRETLAIDVIAELVATGPLVDLLVDPEVRAVYMNGPKSIFVDRGGEASEANGRVFASVGTYLRGLARLGQREADALGDLLGLDECHLEDGSVLRLIGTGGAWPLAVWKRAATTTRSLDELIGMRALGQSHAQLLVQAVLGGRSVLICGAPSDTRAALGSALAAEIGLERRVVVIGDGTSVALAHANVARISPNQVLASHHLGLLDADLVIFERLDASNIAEWVSLALSSAGPVIAFSAEADPERALRRLGAQLELAAGPTNRAAAIIGEAVNLVASLQTQVDGAVQLTKLVTVDVQGDGAVLNAAGAGSRR